VGAEAVGPPIAIIHTFRDGRILKMEWHFNPDEALAEFGRSV
jgi:hypothetical protein